MQVYGDSVGVCSVLSGSRSSTYLDSRIQSFCDDTRLAHGVAKPVAKLRLDKVERDAEDHEPESDGIDLHVQRRDRRIATWPGLRRSRRA